MARLEFYFDLISPYSRIACHRLGKWIKTNDVELVCIPVSLVAIVKASSDGAMPNKKKRMHSLIDLKRAALLYGIPDFDASNSKIMGNSKSKEIHLKMTELSNKRIDLEELESLYKKYWSFSRKIDNQNEGVIVVGKEHATLTDGDGTALVENTKKAIECGAFGLPWFVLVRTDRRDEVYFGSDRLEHIALDVQKDVVNNKSML